MHLQSELENYKLQVELLQERLQRSEDNRQELELKLEQIMKKRREHEIALRSRSQKKYRQFLDEQKRRNERNHKLVEMLEQIDEQAAALAARSERLKMMKLQYEFYFSKLAQSYSLKTLQNIPSVPIFPIQKSTNPCSSETSDNTVQENKYSRSLSNSSAQFQTVPIPVVVPLSNDQNRLNSNWAFATAPSGVLISLGNSNISSAGMTASKENETSFGLDYSKFPIGYLQTPRGLSMQYAVNDISAELYNLPRDLREKTLFTPAVDINRPNLQYESKAVSPTSFPFTDVKLYGTLLQESLPERNQFNEKKVRSDTPEISNKVEDEANVHAPVSFRNFRIPEMSSSDLLMPSQSLKVDILSNIRNSNSSSQERTENGREQHRENKSNVIDCRTDGNDYIKSIKEMKETYEKNDPTPINSPSQEHSIDNITTTLQVQKIDETTVKGDEKINDIEDNEKSTSSAFPSLGGKCSMESIGDEALTKKSLENKTTENTSNAAAKNIDPSRDTEQITLFNGTKNSRDESIGASNRTSAITDGRGENVDNSENIFLETNYRPMHFDKKEKMSIESIETAIYGELLPKPENITSTNLLNMSPMKNEKNMNDMKYMMESEQQEHDINSQNNAFDLMKDPDVQPEEYSPGSKLIQNESQIDANNKKETYKNSSEKSSYEMSEYRDQSYDYTNLSQDNKSPIQVESPQRKYSSMVVGQPPQTENYVNDYHNYDTTQYETNYDANAYQYEYDQQYNNTNQVQYAPEVSEIYNQDYSQDPYTQEYVNYDQNAPSELESANQPYVEQEYASEDQPGQALSGDIEKPISVEQEPQEVKPEVEIWNQHTSKINEPNEESVTKNQSTPTSILSTEKHTDLATKKKKRVNFVDSETDESSTLPKVEAGSSESDFDFSEK